VHPTAKSKLRPAQPQQSIGRKSCRDLFRIGYRNASRLVQSGEKHSRWDGGRWVRNAALNYGEAMAIAVEDVAKI